MRNSKYICKFRNSKHNYMAKFWNSTTNLHQQCDLIDLEEMESLNFPKNFVVSFLASMVSE